MVKDQRDDFKRTPISVDPTFFDTAESALELFPRYGIRELDGVILTHGHADACYGMDGLRQWTLHGAIQPAIDIYLSRETMDTIKITFPFLVDVRHATGLSLFYLYITVFLFHFVLTHDNFPN